MGLSKKEKRELLELFNKKRLKTLLLITLREDYNKYYYIHNGGIQYLSPEYNIDSHNINFEYREGYGFGAWVDRCWVSRIFSIFDIFTKDYWEYRSLRNKMCDVAPGR